MDLIDACAEAGLPLQDKDVDRWKTLLTDDLALWAPKLGVLDPDELEADRSSQSLSLLEDLDWAQVLVHYANAKGMSFPAVGEIWKEWRPDWAELPEAVQRRALSLYEKDLDRVMEMLYMGESYIDWQILGAVRHYAIKLVPLVVGGGLPVWVWLAARARASDQTDGLYGSYDAREIVVGAIDALDLPVEPRERLRVLELLSLELPGCLLEDGLVELQWSLAEELGVGELAGLQRSTIKRKISRVRASLVAKDGIEGHSS